MKALGIHIFAGGFSVGVRDAGFELLGHLELSNYGAETSRKNLGIPVVENHSDWGAWDVPACNTDLIYSNPPCAPWSSAGSKIIGDKRNYDAGFDPRDERVKCVEQAFEVFERLLPPVFMWESVTRCWTAGRPMVDMYAQRALDLGYSFTVVMADGFDCGVTQHRKRAFFVAHKIEIPWVSPKESRPEDASKTVGDVLLSVEGHLESQGLDPADERCAKKPWGICMECLKATPPGKKLRDAYMRIYGETRYNKEKNRYGGRPGFLYTRLDRAKHCPTITGSPAFFHPDHDRTLTLREMGALCGYPLDYEFVGSINNCYAQVAQAVMPPAGRWVASQVRKGLERDETVTVPTYSCTDFIDGRRKEFGIKLDPPRLRV